MIDDPMLLAELIAAKRDQQDVEWRAAQSWMDGHKTLAEAMHAAWARSGRPEILEHDMEAWQGFSLLVLAELDRLPQRRAAVAAIASLSKRTATYCECGSFAPDSSGDAGCGNCGADYPPDRARSWHTAYHGGPFEACPAPVCSGEVLG